MLSRIGLIAMALFVALLLGTIHAPSAGAQATGDTTIIQAQSAITLTLITKDGETLIVPVMLDVEAVQDSTGATVEIVDVTVDHGNNYLVDIENIGPISATVLAATDAALAEPTVASTSTAGPSRVVATGTGRLNLRAGPGTDFDVVGQIAAGDELTVVAQNADGSWLELEDGTWIAAFLVEGLPDTVPTAVPTATPRPTATLQPTATPTPLPTATPVPTVDPIALRAYGLEVAENADLLAKSLNGLSELFLNPMLFDDSWTIQVAANIAMLWAAYDAVAEITPPAGLEDLHAQVLDVFETCKLAGDHAIAGIDNVDVDEMELAAIYVESCGTKANQVAEALELLNP